MSIIRKISSLLNSLQEKISGKSIYHHANSRSNAAMDVKQIRKANLRRLIAEVGTAAELAHRTGGDPSHISQIVSRKGRRNVGDSLARDLERKLEKPYGWMDHDHSGEASPDEQAVLAYYRQMLDPDKDLYKELGRSLAEKASGIYPEEELPLAASTLPPEESRDD